MEEKILCVLKNVLGLESATKALSQQNCDKWDSLRHLNLIVELESEFGVEFDPEEISGMKCFEDIERVLTQNCDMDSVVKKTGELSDAEIESINTLFSRYLACEEISLRFERSALMLLWDIPYIV